MVCTATVSTITALRASADASVIECSVRQPEVDVSFVCIDDLLSDDYSWNTTGDDSDYLISSMYISDISGIIIPFVGSLCCSAKQLLLNVSMKAHGCNMLEV